MNNNFDHLIIEPNKLFFPDGRLLACFFPEREVWECYKWHGSDFIGIVVIGLHQEDFILDQAMFEGIWVDCLECERARGVL